MLDQAHFQGGKIANLRAKKLYENKAICKRAGRVVAPMPSAIPG